MIGEIRWSTMRAKAHAWFAQRRLAVFFAVRKAEVEAGEHVRGAW